jgi:hypothetical protein
MKQRNKKIVTSKKKRYNRQLDDQESQGRDAVPSPLPLAKSIQTKYFDTTLTGTLNPGSITLVASSLNLIQTGDTVTSRDGNEINVLSVEFAIKVIESIISASASYQGAVRFLPFLDYQPNGAAIATTDILANNDPMSFVNVVERRRFHIYADEYLDVPVIPTSATASFTINSASYGFAIRRKYMVKQRFSFTASTGAITDVMVRNLGLIMAYLGNGGTATVSGYARVYFSG